MQHIPVLYSEILQQLDPQPRQQFVDMTLGLGGHTTGLLERTAPDGVVYSFDQVPVNIVRARDHLKAFGDRVRIFHSNFAHFAAVLQEQGISAVDGILFDLGIASPHLDDPERGFSFRYDGPLDMRMNPAAAIPTAADLVNNLSAEDLQFIFQEYGEQPRSRTIAESIVQRREQKLFTQTQDLAEHIADHFPKYGRKGGGHPAALAFQALRIAVNKELDVLRDTLPQTLSFLRTGARLAVISFHSLEDRIVKDFFRQYSARDKLQKYPQSNMNSSEKYPLKTISKKPILPSREEVETNPRARSARLRVAEKIL